ncbi:LuxR C-terminal-related transcriptional regulator [Streptomyces violascens]|uniref:helix-turn-helix transcriptional regulator n=1 Tax=Streptomyces violascens TaxID=67381 RepID=UPI00379997B5
MNADLDLRQARQLAEAQDRDREELHQLAVSEQTLSPTQAAETRNADADADCRPVMGVNAIRDWLVRSALRCRREILLAQPGDGRRAESALLDMTEPLASLLDRGVKVRTIHQHTARHDTAIRTGVARAVGGGGEARTSSGPLSPMVVFDRETALVPGDDGQSAVAVSQPGIVHFMTEVFERMWMAAMPFDGQARAAQAGEPLSGMRRTIIVLLAEGRTDAMIARRIGVSVRTCRNHIARIYQELGAQSRFQLGVLVTRSGLLGPAEDAASCSPPVKGPTPL